MRVKWNCRLLIRMLEDFLKFQFKERKLAGMKIIIPGMKIQEMKIGHFIWLLPKNSWCFYHHLPSFSWSENSLWLSNGLISERSFGRSTYRKFFLYTRTRQLKNFEVEIFLSKYSIYCWGCAIFQNGIHCNRQII